MNARLVTSDEFCGVGVVIDERVCSGALWLEVLTLVGAIQRIDASKCYEYTAGAAR